VNTPPIPVALPLAVAALLAAVNRRVPHAVSMTLAILTSMAVGGVAISLIAGSRYDPIVYWFGGWVPRQQAAIGICFVIDNIGAMLVLINAVLMTAALIFAWCYFDTAGALFPVLMLVFLAGMSGFSLTGDLFNLFVFFELMSVAAFSLCAYKTESPLPLQGALNFAVTNIIGGFLVLAGIGLLYGRTGALNMAQIGRTLRAPADSLVIAAFAFLMCGFMVKSAIIPFHFWLADAHAVAPAPVSALFSGIMVELGLYAVARVYWTAFSGALGPHEDSLRNLLVGFGAATAALGAAMCYFQRNLKRLLAFSTVSHLGLMLMGVALLTPDGLAGASIYAAGHAMVKGALFLAAGILLHRTGTLDFVELARGARKMPWTGGLFFAGAAGLAGVPPFGTFRGETMMSASAKQLGYGWISWLHFAAAVVTSAAVVRFSARVFLHRGPPPGELAESRKIPEKPDTKGGHAYTPAAMYMPAAVLLLFGVLLGITPRLTGAAESAAIFLENRSAYAQHVLDALALPPPRVHNQPATGADIERAIAAVVLAGLLGFARARRAAPENAFRDLQSGIIPDYVTWLVVGVAVFGSGAFLWLR
jgi:multicomponent Na+:H+ antiporter subunit D